MLLTVIGRVTVGRGCSMLLTVIGRVTVGRGCRCY